MKVVKEVTIQSDTQVRWAKNNRLRQEQLIGKVVIFMLNNKVRLSKKGILERLEVFVKHPADRALFYLQPKRSDE